jgi:predicted permease
MKAFFSWDSQKTTSFRRFTFNVLLPIYVFRNMWISNIDSTMYGIATASLIVHIVQGFFWAMLYSQVADKYMRGWLSMISQGCLTSFLYANLSNHVGFGQPAIAICLLWDIGGNTPCAQGLLWGIAAYFAPTKSVDAVDGFETAFSNPLLRESPSGSPSREEGLYKSSRTITKQGLQTRDLELETTLGDAYEMDSLLSGNSERDTFLREKSWSDIIKAVLYQPILPAFLMGLFLSVHDAGCPVVLDLSLEAIGLLFKPCLYFLIGLHTDIIRDFNQFKIVATVLGLRYLFAGFIAVIIWLWFPFGNLERTTMALSFLSPASTMTMYLVAEYGYPARYISMSAALTTISVFLSFIIQEGVMRSY